MSAGLAQALDAALADWDGRSTSGLEAFHRRHADDAALLDLCLDLLPGADAAAGASWLIKRQLETGAAVTPDQLARLCQALPACPDWASTLHLLQCLDLTGLPADHCDGLLVAVTSLLDADNRFVRAWAYNALGLLGRARPDWRDAMTRRLEQGLDVESGAVAARIRKALRV